MWINSNPQRKQAFLNTLTAEKRRWMPHRWMVKYYMKASPAVREKLKAKIQRSALRLKPSILNPFNLPFQKYHWVPLWQKPVFKPVNSDFQTINTCSHHPDLNQSHEPDLLI
jgi:hypothetical protein